MQTVERIEKRRRELQFISYGLIYLLALVVVGLFFFIDHVAGFLGTLKYNMFLRVYFVGFIVAFILYLAQKEKQQSNLMSELVGEMDETSGKLAKEVSHNKFLSEISYLVGNLRDNLALEQLFQKTLKFLGADGGAVVLRDKTAGWQHPLVCFPEEDEAGMVDRLIKIVSKSGQPFLQPNAQMPEHRLIKETRTIISVPLRLEGRLFGLIAFWADNDRDFDDSDLEVIEVIAREAANSAFSVEQLQTHRDQFKGVLEILAQAGEKGGKSQKRTIMIARQAKALARQLNLPRETVEAIETAGMLKNVDRVLKNGGAAADEHRSAATILQAMSFPPSVTEILRTGALNGTNGNARSMGARILAISEAYINAANPSRGRKPDPALVLSKLQADNKTNYGDDVIGALRELIDALEDNAIVEPVPS